MVWNRGISCGLLPAGSPLGVWLLIGFSLGMSVVLTWWLFRAEGRWLALGLGLVVGGARECDRPLRLWRGGRLFHFHAFGKSWYVFSVADAAIVMGVVGILIDALFIARPARRRNWKDVSDDAR